jgi:protein phosphatase
MQITVGALSDVGRVRDHNEDGYLIDDELGLVAVADGMGGHRGGGVASAVALAALRDAFTRDADLGDAVRAANLAVFERSHSDEAVRGMGTTLTTVVLGESDVARIGHVGDSRAYLWRDGELRRLTTDHSLVEELVRAGELTQEEADRDPRRSMITRALGLDPDVEVDQLALDLQSGDRLLLCSDGLTSMITEIDIADLLAAAGDPTAVAQRLVDAANAAGGADNTTVLVVDVAADDPGSDGDELDDDLPEAELVEIADGDHDQPKTRRSRWPFRRR